MKLESLFDTKERINELMNLLNKPDNKLAKGAFWALWDDRNSVISEWGKLHEKYVRNHFTP